MGTCSRGAVKIEVPLDRTLNRGGAYYIWDPKGIRNVDNLRHMCTHTLMWFLRQSLENPDPCAKFVLLRRVWGVQVLGNQGPTFMQVPG